MNINMNSGLDFPVAPRDLLPGKVYARSGRPLDADNVWIATDENQIVKLSTGYQIRIPGNEKFRELAATLSAG